MSTFLHLTDAFPDIGGKLFWMKANRILAWSLIVSPPLQWAAGMSFLTGLLIDLAILLVHGLLSLALYGKPENKARSFSFSMHVMGFRDKEMSERNRFLLTGYRMLLAAFAIAVPIMYIPAVVLVLYPLLRLPITLVQHILLAMEYALRRWGVNRAHVSGLAMVGVFVYLALSLMNMARAIA